MATAARPKPLPAAAQRDAAVEEVITAAAHKLRANDLFVGAAAAAVVTLGYVALVVLLDKLFELPDWVRQLGFVGFLGGLAAVVYFLILLPMRRRVNPRYVARQIEGTIPDAKNALINWVDLQAEPLPGSVKAAIGANAAEGVAEADVESATSSKRVVWLTAAAGGLLLTLAVLFLVFSGPQFFSLLRRAVVPFQPTAVATATAITVVEPDGGDVTVTDGQPLAIAVSLTGRVPDPTGPDKPRLLVRYHPESDEVVELPLISAGSSREFRTDLGRGTILNGLWYRVAAGDAVTPEYRVTVRTRPMLGEFKVKYDYPAYLKWPSDSEENSKLRALRGTVATLSVKANRSVDSATLITSLTDGGREVVRGEVFGEGRDRIRFPVKLRESGTYRIEFDPAGVEVATSSAYYPIEVEVDHAPVVVIATPKEDEIPLPQNGLLAVDGTVKDDHGIAGVELRFKVVGNDALSIKPKAFRDGKPLVREQDGTLLTDLPDYKDSVKLDALSDDASKPVKLKESDVLEYWLAAADNCTEPAANVGESAHKRVRLLPSVTEPEKQQQQTTQEQQRKQEEKQGEQKREQQLKNEKRPEEQGRNPDRQPQDQPPQENQDPKGEKGEGQKQDQPSEGQPNNGGKGGDTPPNDKDLQQKADDLQKKIEEKKQQEKQQAGDARGNGDQSEGQETKPDGGAKPPEGKDGGMPQASESKGGPPPEENGKPNDPASEGKDGGRLVETPKTEEKSPPNPDAKGEQKPTDDTPKQAPKEGSQAGASKESKEPELAKPGEPKNPKPENGKKDDGQASAGRGAEPQDPKGGTDSPKPNEKPVDKSDLGHSKPDGKPERATTKPEPKGGDDANREAGGAKGEAPPKPADSKDAPKGENQPMPKGGPPPDAASPKESPKPGEKDGDPAEGKGEGKKPDQPMGTDKGEEKATGKPSEVSKDPMKGDGTKPDDKNPMSGSGEKTPNDPMGGNSKPEDPMKPMPGGGTGEKKPGEKDPKPQPGGSGEKQPDAKKLDPKEVEQAVKDLESKDEKTKQAAQEKLDKAVGKANREEIEKVQKDLKSDDKATREAAEKKLQEMAKNAQKGDSQQPRELTEQEKKELADAAKKLNSKDEAERKAAEQKLDEAIGKENRQELQQDLQDLVGDDPGKAEQARKKLEKKIEEAKKAQRNNPSDATGDRKGDRPGGDGSKQPGKPTEGNLENQLKSRELALDDFKKYRGDKKFLKENNLTEEQYDRFLKQYEAQVEKLRDQVAERRLNPPDPNLPPTVGRNDTGTVKGRGDADRIGTAGSQGSAPPGFEGAVRRFNAEASKQK